jgi:hypothetical protein
MPVKSPHSERIVPVLAIGSGRGGGAQKANLLLQNRCRFSTDSRRGACPPRLRPTGSVWDVSGAEAGQEFKQR